MVRAMCCQKVVQKDKQYKKTTEIHIDLLGLKEAVSGLSEANGVRWYGLVLNLKAALYFQVSAKREQGRPNKT